VPWKEVDVTTPTGAPPDPRYQRLLEASHGVVGVLRAKDADTAHGLATAALDAGLGAIEITWTTPGAAELVRTLARSPNAPLVGAGTIMHAGDARTAILAGAAFLVSPHLGRDVLAVARDADVPYVPGAATATEVVTAMQLGCPLVKLFPVRELGGPAFVRALLGPLPSLAAMVTGGVAIEDVPAYLDAGARVVGLGAVFGRDAEETRQRVERVLSNGR
jgi:2-dehydro-3-deoxyphosphogluconate aldolase / (4S)-4-hydroxy-2-oxoglutarate aldolase